MNELSCADVRDVAAELALDALDGDQRARALSHLADCEACRQGVDDLSRAADALLTVLPARDVPPELSARLHASVPRRADAAEQPAAARRGRWRRPLLVAAAVLVLTTAGVVVLAIESADAPSGGLGEFALSSPDGTTIGQVAIRGGDPPWISMAVEHGDGTEMLTCVAVLEDGTRVPVGPLPVADGKGSWAGPLELEPDEIVSAELVDGDGNVIASAELE